MTTHYIGSSGSFKEENSKIYWYDGNEWLILINTMLRDKKVGYNYKIEAEVDFSVCDCQHDKNKKCRKKRDVVVRTCPRCGVAYNCPRCGKFYCIEYEHYCPMNIQEAIEEFEIREMLPIEKVVLFGKEE